MTFRAGIVPELLPPEGKGSGDGAARAGSRLGAMPARGMSSPRAVSLPGPMLSSARLCWLQLCNRLC